MLLKEEIDFILEISNFEKFKKMCQKENKLFSDLDEKLQNAIIEKHGFLENFYPKDKENIEKDGEYDFLINLYFNRFSIVERHYPHQFKSYIEKYITSLTNENLREFVLFDQIEKRICSFNEYKNDEKIVKKHFIKTYFKKMSEDKIAELVHDMGNNEEKWIRSANFNNFLGLLMEVCFEDFDFKNNYGKLKFASEHLLGLFAKHATNNVKKFLKYDCVDLMKNLDNFSKKIFIEKNFYYSISSNLSDEEKLEIIKDLKQHDVLNKEQWKIILEKNPNFYEILDKDYLTNKDLFDIIQKQNDLSILAFVDKIDNEFQENLLIPFIEKTMNNISLRNNVEKLYNTTNNFINKNNKGGLFSSEKHFNQNHVKSLIDKGFSDKTIKLLLNVELGMAKFMLSKEQENDQNYIEKRKEIISNVYQEYLTRNIEKLNKKNHYFINQNDLMHVKIDFFKKILDKMEMKNILPDNMIFEFVKTTTEFFKLRNENNANILRIFFQNFNGKSYSYFNKSDLNDKIFEYLENELNIKNVKECLMAENFNSINIVFNKDKKDSSLENKIEENMKKIFEKSIKTNKIL